VADQGEGLVLCELVPVEGTEFAEAPDGHHGRNRR
jgi:hypothetical protein